MNRLITNIENIAIRFSMTIPCFLSRFFRRNPEWKQIQFTNTERHIKYAVQTFVRL